MTATRFNITFTGQVRIRSTDPEVDKALVEVRDQLMDAHFDSVMDCLLELEECDKRLSDSDLSAKLSTGDLEISIMVDASPEEALVVGLGAIRSAIHAAGGYTPGWDDVTPSAKWEMADASSQQRAVELADA